MRAGPSVLLAQVAAVEQKIDKLLAFPSPPFCLLLHGRIFEGQTSQVKILFLAPSMHLLIPFSFIQPAGRTSSISSPTKHRH